MSGFLVLDKRWTAIVGLTIPNLSSFNLDNAVGSQRVNQDVQSALVRVDPMPSPKKNSGGSNPSSKGEAKPGKRKKKMKAQALKKGKQVTYAPSASSALMVTQRPSISSSNSRGDGAVRVRHREFIQDFSGSTAFAISSIGVNPGLPQMFPWLSTIASNFESYLFRALSIEYETSVASTTAGSVMLAVDFDAADSAPTTKVALMTFHNAVRSAAWQESCYTADSQDLQKFGVKRYVRTGNLSANQDIKTYDVGNLLMASQGMGGGGVVGEIYVSYDVELETPQTSASLTTTNSAKVLAASPSAAAPFSSGVLTGGLPIAVGGTTLTFNTTGQFLLTHEVTGTVISGNPNVSASTATISLLDGIFNAAATEGIYQYTVNAQIGQTFSLVWTGAATTVTQTITRLGAYASSLG